LADISILGAGSWGTALAASLCRNGHHVVLWSYRDDQVMELRETRENKSKLPGVILPESLKYTSDLKEAVTDMDLVVFSVPSKATRETATKFKEFLKPGQKIITVTKGIEETTLMNQTEILQDVLGDDMRIGVLSGPSHAEEVAQSLPTLVVVGSKDKDLCVMTQEFFMNENFRVYTSPDVTGIEIGASLKNVIALAAGMSDGLGFGDNAKAALITRGIKEITALSVAMGGESDTLNGLSGIGDLIVTCQSRHSRNRKAGELIGKGMNADQAMQEVAMIVEGVYSAKAAKALGEKYNIELPIIEEVNQVLFYNKDPRTAVLNLMTRDKKKEIDISGWN
jgi:glycerol-3-phosphate dehydrogenase (NAD(P)+)